MHEAVDLADAEYLVPVAEIGLGEVGDVVVHADSILNMGKGGSGTELPLMVWAFRAGSAGGWSLGFWGGRKIAS